MRRKLVIILLIVFFATPLSAQELTGTLQQIKKSGKIRIGYRASEPPMSFLGKDGKVTGYSIDLCKSIVTEVKHQFVADVHFTVVPITLTFYDRERPEFFNYFNQIRLIAHYCVNILVCSGSLIEMAHVLHIVKNSLHFLSLPKQSG